MKALFLAIILQILCIQAKSQTNDLLALFNKVDAATKQITSGQYKLNDTSVYNGKQIEKLYHVYSSPALFVINGNSEIACSLDGYSDTLIKDVL